MALSLEVVGPGEGVSLGVGPLKISLWSQTTQQVRPAFTAASLLSKAHCPKLRVRINLRSQLLLSDVLFTRMRKVKGRWGAKRQSLAGGHSFSMFL